MAEDRYTFRLDIAARAAAGELDALAEGTDAVNDELSTTRSLAAKVAEVVGKAATDMRTELQHAEEAAGALGEAIGPELADKIGRARINEWVTELRAAGLEFDDIKTNAHDLGTQLARLEEVRIDAVAKGFGRVADDADRARSVTANMAGNLAQELPGIAGQFGPVNMAISQLVEGLAEGGIKGGDLTKQLGLMAGGLGAFALLSPLVQGILDLGAADEEAAKRAGELTTANRDASDSLDVQTLAALDAATATRIYGDALRENADNIVRDKIVNDRDMIAAMDAYGITIEEIIAATHDLNAAQDLNNRITKEATKRGDATDTGVILRNKELSDGLLGLVGLIKQQSIATAQSTDDMVKLARAGDLLSIEYLKATNQLDLLTPAEQRRAEKVLDNAAADDKATEAARRRAAAQRELADSLDPATQGRMGEAARGSTTIYYPAGADPARYREESAAWARRNGGT